jgi:hypothetical protein
MAVIEGLEVPEILCNTNIYGIGEGLHPVANRASYRPAIGTWEAAVLVSRRSDRGVGIHPRRLLNRWEAAAICYWSRGTPCNAESAICVFFTRILTALRFTAKRVLETNCFVMEVERSF